MEEIQRLLQASPPHRRLLYETAFVSGLRAGEWRSLQVDDLEVRQCGLHLDAAWTKNRQPGLQPLPRVLVERLAASARPGQAMLLYRAKCGERTEGIPERPLLYVPDQPDRSIKQDLEAAGIPLSTPQGKIDFHAARTAFVTMLLESGVTVKEAQHLARHSTLQLTMNVYGRTRDASLAEAVERLGVRVLLPKAGAATVPRGEDPAEMESASLEETETCASYKVVAGVGFEPTTFGL
ncbi:MAG: site-specific integrase [Candidatus Latescibacterota bacterium]